MQRSRWAPVLEHRNLSFENPVAGVRVSEVKEAGVKCDWYGIAVKRNLSDPAAVRTLCSLLSAIGRHVVNLRTLRQIEARQGFLETVVTQCANLERLDLEHCNLTSLGIAPLLCALRSSALRGKLVGLYLGHNQLTDTAIVALADCLKAPKRKSALRKLHLNDNLVTAFGIDTLADALKINKTLQQQAISWEKSFVAMMDLPEVTRNYTAARQRPRSASHP